MSNTSRRQGSASTMTGDQSAVKVPATSCSSSLLGTRCKECRAISSNGFPSRSERGAFYCEPCWKRAASSISVADKMPCSLCSRTLAGYFYKSNPSSDTNISNELPHKRQPSQSQSQNASFLCSVCIAVFEARKEGLEKQKRQQEEDAALLVEPITWDVMAKRAGCAHVDQWLNVLLAALQVHARDLELSSSVVRDVRSALGGAGLDACVYGSRRTGLVTSESDFDFAVRRCSKPKQRTDDPCDEHGPYDDNKPGTVTGGRKLMDLVAEALKGATAAQELLCFDDVEVIHAKVPLVRCKHRASGALIDFAFSALGIMSTDYLIRQLQGQRAEVARFARPLIVLTKVLLASAKLHDANFGGLGSYATSMLVLWFLRQPEASVVIDTQQHSSSSTSIATLWIAFLQYWGSDFDCKTRGVDPLEMKQIPSNKMKSYQSYHPQGICIRHPTARDSNAANGCTKFQTTIRALFSDAATAMNHLARMKYVMKSSDVFDAADRLVFRPMTAACSDQIREHRLRTDASGPQNEDRLLPQNEWNDEGIYCGGLSWKT